MRQPGGNNPKRHTMLFLFVRRPAQDGIVEQCVLNVDHHRGRRVNLRERFNRQNGLKERAPLSPVLLRQIDRQEGNPTSFAAG